MTVRGIETVGVAELECERRQLVTLTASLLAERFPGEGRQAAEYLAFVQELVLGQSAAEEETIHQLGHRDAAHGRAHAEIDLCVDEIVEAVDDEPELRDEILGVGTRLLGRMLVRHAQTHDRALVRRLRGQAHPPLHGFVRTSRADVFDSDLAMLLLRKRGEDTKRLRQRVAVELKALRLWWLWRERGAREHDVVATEGGSILRDIDALAQSLPRLPDAELVGRIESLWHRARIAAGSGSEHGLGGPGAEP